MVRRRSFGCVLPLGRHASTNGSKLIQCASDSMALSSFQEGQNARHHNRFKREQALSHPMCFQYERTNLLARARSGQEDIRHIGGRFFIKRLVNVGATGYQRSWTDNILWHHFCHFVDLGAFLFQGTPIRRVQSYMGQPHRKTGIPMECVVLIETDADQSFVVHGSYHAALRYYDHLIVTDRDTYFYDILAGTVRSSEGTEGITAEQDNAARIIFDFLDAVRSNRPP